MTIHKRIAVLGAGQIGVIIAGMLAEQGHQVTLADASAAQLKHAAGGRFATETVDASNLDALRVFLKDRDIVVSACPYFLNKGIAKVAAETKTHYFDLTDRKSVVKGKSVDLGGRRIIKTKNRQRKNIPTTNKRQLQ